MRSRELFKLVENGNPAIALQVQRSTTTARADVIYVHGATFCANLSIYYPFDDRSWGDALAGAGFNVWGFDFVGYGESDRYREDHVGPAGAMDAAIADLRRVVAAVRERNGDRPVVLLAHSRGGAVAARYAGDFPHDLSALVLFAPVFTRTREEAAAFGSATAGKTPSHRCITVLAQYRRFIEDVPRGHPQVLDEAHMHAWGEAYLATDPTSGTRVPPSVNTPYGPVADVLALWSGQSLYDPKRIVAPTLLVRGEWDSACDDDDAASLMAALGSADKAHVKIERATHLMHLETQRGALYDEVNRFLAHRFQ
jgi:alpha-beta hydrolase superfamily lysophospholipase